MKITKEEVQYVADLARLTLSKEEKEVFTTHLNDILMYVDILKSADTMDVEPMSHVVESAETFRDDVVTPSIGTDAALANAPDHNGSAFRVPRVIE